MMASQRVNITTPVGRLVMGSLYKANTTDAEGKPLQVKNGPNAGQPRLNYFLALAVPKGPEQHWSQTPWGNVIWAKGHEHFPQAARSADFAWKIEDGDSVAPNKKGRRPVDNEGWAGHWILKFSGGYAPKVYRAEGGGYVQVTDIDYVKPGYFIEVNGTVDGNGSQSQPGIYLNHSMVCFRAFGPEIHFGPDVNEAGFGQSALPPGATLTPPPSTLPMPAAIPMTPAPVVAPVVSQPIPVSVTPNPAFLQVPPPAAVPVPASIAAIPLPPVPSAPIASPSSGPRMTALANGASYQAYIQAGWKDADLIAQGYMTM